MIIAVAVLGVTGLALSATAPDARALSSWSVSPARLSEEPEEASSMITANGRLWQLSFDHPSHAVMRWHRLSDGRGAARSVRIHRPRGSDLDSEALGGSDVQLFVAGRRGFVSGTWCLKRDDENECLRSRGFEVQFALGSGHILRSARPRDAPLLVGGSRVSYLVRPTTGPVVLRDAITRRLVRRLPRGARDVQGAGPFVSWKDPDADERRHGDPSQPIGPGWNAIHVRERLSGRVVYDLRYSALRAAIQPKGGVAVQEADLTPDGSLSLAVDVDADRSFRPVVVDAAGRIQPVSEAPMRRPNQFWSAIRGDRVLFYVDTNGDGRCGPRTGWLTDVGGHYGNDFRALPRTPRYRIRQSPEFESPTTMSWLESRGDVSDNRYRIRVGHDLRSLPLTRDQRPRC